MFITALRTSGEPLRRADVFGYIARLPRQDGESLHSIVEGPFAGIAIDRPAQHRPLIGRFRGLVGVGDVRLDNRADALHWVRGAVRPEASDLEVALAVIDSCGEDGIADLIGDFGFVAWDARAQKLLAVRDAFGVKPLHLRDTGDLVLFSSSCAPLRHDESYDLEYVADYLLGLNALRERTIWSGVESVPAGAFLRQRGSVRDRRQYWSPSRFTPALDGDERANTERFRELFEDAVRVRMAGAGDVWAQLSGGLDSSSVVSMAHRLGDGQDRLAGTITVVDSLGMGDERIYSDAVVRRYGLRNEQVRDYAAWQEDCGAPPAIEQPYPMYPFYARDRRLHDIAKQAGARVMLSGMGADHYLYGSLDYITDMVGARRFRLAARELTEWSVVTRQSFWRLGRQYALQPFLPALGSPAGPGVPPWIDRSFARQRDLGSRLVDMRVNSARPGQRFAHRVALGIEAITTWIERWPFGRDIELRYPFLHRPLVELSLALPAQHRVRPLGRKWILREACRDVLPAEVRQRTTKGGIDGRILWSLRHERARIDAMLRDPVLGQLGCIDVDVLRAAVDAAGRGVPTHNVYLWSALSLETWFAVRNDRWPHALRVASTAA